MDVLMVRGKLTRAKKQTPEVDANERERRNQKAFAVSIANTDKGFRGWETRRRNAAANEAHRTQDPSIEPQLNEGDPEGAENLIEGRKDDTEEPPAGRDDQNLDDHSDLPRGKEQSLSVSDEDEPTERRDERDVVEPTKDDDRRNFSDSGQARLPDHATDPGDDGLIHIEENAATWKPDHIQQNGDAMDRIPADIFRYLLPIQAHKSALLKIDSKIQPVDVRYFKVQAELDRMLDSLFTYEATTEAKLEALQYDQMTPEQQTDIYHPFFAVRNRYAVLQKRQDERQDQLNRCRRRVEDALLRRVRGLTPLSDEESSIASSSGNSPDSEKEHDGDLRTSEEKPKQVAARLLEEAGAEWQDAETRFHDWRDGYDERLQAWTEFDQEYLRRWQKFDRARIEAETGYKKALSEADKLHAIVSTTTQTSRFPDGDADEHAEGIAESIDFTRKQLDRPEVERWAENEYLRPGPSGGPTPPGETDKRVASIAFDEIPETERDPKRQRKIRGWLHVAQKSWVEMRETLVSLPSESHEVIDEAVVEQQRDFAAKDQNGQGGPDMQMDHAGQGQDQRRTFETGSGTDRPTDDCSDAVGDRHPGILGSETARSRRSRTPSYSRWLRRKHDEARLRGHEEGQYSVNRFDDWKASQRRV